MSQAITETAKPNMARNARDMPLVSFIHFCRNDDYAADIVIKLAHSIEVLARQIAQRHLAAEIIVVDWNPPADKASLSEILEKSIRHACNVDIIVITVPPRYHDKVHAHEVVPFSVTNAMNVGIRRARGKFCVTRASDVYYSDELMDFLASGKLDASKVYRCLRQDVAIDVTCLQRQQPLDVPAVIRREARIVYTADPLAESPYPPMARLFTNASGDFLLASRAAFATVRGFRESLGAASVDHDGLLLHSFVASGLQELVIPAPAMLWKLSHGAHTRERVREEEDIELNQKLDNFTKRVGDFCQLCNGSISGEYVNYFKFWIGLIRNRPKRYIGVGSYTVPPYILYQYYVHILFKKYISMNELTFPRDVFQYFTFPNKKYAKTFFLFLTGETARFIWSIRPQTLSKAGYLAVMAKMALICLWFRYRPRSYVFNGPGWGFGGARLPMRRLRIPE